MNKTFETIKEMLNYHNGYITTTNLREKSIPSIYLTRLYTLGKLERITDDIYKEAGLPNDELYINYLICNMICYSKYTALFLNGLLPRFQDYLEVDLPYGYPHPDIKNVKFYETEQYIYNTGQALVKTTRGNYCLTYTKERCICDLVLFKELYSYDIKKLILANYAKTEHNNNDLIEMADRLEIGDEISKLIKEYNL